MQEQVEALYRESILEIDGSSMYIQNSARSATILAAGLDNKKISFTFFPPPFSSISIERISIQGVYLYRHIERGKHRS
jgi:hypothetical protein